MRFIKRNRGIIFALVIFFIGVLFCVQLKNILFPNDRAAVYGNRLDGIVELDKNTNSKVKEAVGSVASKVSVRTSGKIINVFITVNDDVNRDNAKNLASKVLETFSAEEKEYYDVQLFITKNNKEAKEFPIVGYKIPSADRITWTKDR